MAKTRTMYMHTMDRHAASFAETPDGPYMYFAGGRSKARLVPSLRQILRERARAVAASTGRWSDPAIYGYVLVEIPSAR